MENIVTVPIEYTYLSEVTLTKPSPMTPWFQDVYPVETEIIHTMWDENNLIYQAEYMSETECKLFFYYYNESHRNNFQTWFNQQQVAIDLSNYEQTTNIVRTQIYLGPRSEYNG